jgi:hypothetical protein
MTKKIRAYAAKVGGETMEGMAEDALQVEVRREQQAPSDSGTEGGGGGVTFPHPSHGTHAWRSQGVSSERASAVSRRGPLPRKQCWRRVSKFAVVLYCSIPTVATVPTPV